MRLRYRAAAGRLTTLGGMSAPYALYALYALSASSAPPPAHINENRTPAGTLKNGVLTLRLEVMIADWHPESPTGTGIILRAFAEAGKPPEIPGPLIRVPRGTRIDAFVHNTLDAALILHGLGGDLSVPAGATRELSLTADSAGTFFYWGSTRAGGITDRIGLDNELSGAFIVDPPGITPHDRIFVLAEWNRDGPRPGGIPLASDLLRFTINGKAWPFTERLSYVTGDTVRFHIVNTSDTPHPMHLHGFYFRVDSRNQMVVTERIAPGRTAAITWVPERAGYWLFHCHNNAHILRNQPLDGAPLPPEQTLHVTNHAVAMMGGLVMGIEVLGSVPLPDRGPRRTLRLIAAVDPPSSDFQPSYGYVLEDPRHPVSHAGPLLPGPTLLLQRGQPVSITVVNHLPEATAVHWHGIELDSYMDGVGDFSGHPGHIASAIAPGDSFVASFTPPRSGTFIYHPHADELRQQEAGMSGALLVVDDPAAFDPVHDRVMLISTPRRHADSNYVFINGSTTPDTLPLKVGETYRLRLINIHTYRPSIILRLLRDSTALTWRAVAKDGMSLPPERALEVPAVQQMGNGETYDYEFTPKQPGAYRLIVTSGIGILLATQPIRVH